MLIEKIKPLIVNHELILDLLAGSEIFEFVETVVVTYFELKKTRRK